MVPRGGIEPPTRGFSIDSVTILLVDIYTFTTNSYTIKARFNYKNHVLKSVLKAWCRVELNLTVIIGFMLQSSSFQIAVIDAR